MPGPKLKMRRPLCVFCVGTLGAELVCAFLPQVERLLPLAAFLLLGGLWGLHRKKERGVVVCLLLGALLGLAIMGGTRQRTARVQAAYADRKVRLTAEVERVSAGYYPGVVNAVLWVEEADGEAERFRVEVVSLPKTAVGQRVRGCFALEAPGDSDALDLYADGIVLQGECVSKLTRLGESGRFRARTARLQKRLSAALRKGIPQAPGGVLAAMVLGDRSALSRPLNAAYRAAGLSHVLVVSGMHVSILCGAVFVRRKREQSYASRRLQALWRAALALLLVGITGFTPSVLRAAVVVWVASLGVWVYGAPDALTSLGVAGVALTLGNGYAVCDVGFELSFSAVLGTLAGAELARRGCRAMRGTQSLRKAKRLRNVLEGFWETVCVSGCAAAATFPVLVLRGLSASLYALVSSVAVLWLVEPILRLGVAAALLGLLPAAVPLYRLAAYCAAFLTDLLDRWALWVSGWPGAQLSFDTAYAAIVCLLLLGLGWLAAQWRVRLRVALPALLLAAAVALGAGNALNYNVVRVELTGSRNAPAVVISCRGQAVVLFRGGDATQRAVEQLFARRGIREAELLLDLRTTPKTACTLEAKKRIGAAKMDRYAARRISCGLADLEILRTQNGCIVRITAAGRKLAALSGSVQLAKPVRVEWLLASPADPEAVRYENCLTLSDQYRWMREEDAFETRKLLRLRA